MGSGSFVVEASTQLAHAYIERKQAETQSRIASADYGGELARVMRFFLTNRTYGVDRNRMAVELAHLALWLSVLEDGPTTPFLAPRLKHGDSLIGARHQWYRSTDLEQGSSLGDPDGSFHQPIVSGGIFHFLVADPAMVSSQLPKLTNELSEYAGTYRRWCRDVCETWSAQETERAAALSQQIEALWRQVTRKRHELLRQLGDAAPMWGNESQTKHTKRPRSLELADFYNGHETENLPIKRLRAVLNYWCALWFWPLEAVSILPSRKEWLDDVSDLVSGDPAQLTEEKERIRIAQEVAEKHAFFHWELEFPELFERGGPDLTLGNPPWIPVEWKEADVLSDYDPRFAIRNLGGSREGQLREAVLGSSNARRGVFAEVERVAGIRAFIGSPRNYPYLSGVQANLYKAFLGRGWTMGRREGRVAFFCHAGILDHSGGTELRRALLERADAIFRFQNMLGLFPDVGGPAQYALTISRCRPKSEPNFLLATGLQHPRTLDQSFGHDGAGAVPGIKTPTGEWELRGHRDRILEIGLDELALFAKVLDTEGTDPRAARIPLVHCGPTLDVLRKLSEATTLSALEGRYVHDHGYDEKKNIRAGVWERNTHPAEDVDELILSGPHCYLATPFQKTPRPQCKSKGDYDAVDLESIPNDYLPRTNYRFTASPKSGAGAERYRHVNRAMVVPTNERTLIPAIIPPHAKHTTALFSLGFDDQRELALFSGLASSIVADFLIKTSGIANIKLGVVKKLPVRVSAALEDLITARVARLNCVTSHYLALWENLYRDSWTHDRFASNRLSTRRWSELASTWKRDAPLRTPLERRQGLVELDALAALGLGLTLAQLQLVWELQFPVAQQYEMETFYDQRGRIVFTSSKVLSGVGVSRREWTRIANAIRTEELPSSAADEKGPYEPPFFRMNRAEDLTVAYHDFSARIGDPATSQEVS